MVDIISLLEYGLPAFGGVTLLSIGISRWLANRMADRLYLKWKHDYDVDMEKLRDQLSTTRVTLEAVLASVSQAQQAAQERILKAVELLWTTVVEYRDYAYPILSTYEMLMPNEYHLAVSKLGLGEVVKLDFMKQITEIGKKPEQFRPFLGERLWTLYWVYRAAIGRLCLKVIEGRDNGKIQPWNFEVDGKRDDYLLKLLGYVLSEEEIKLIPPSIMVTTTLMNILEQKILLEAERRIAGRHVADIGLEESRRLRDALLQAGRSVT